MRQYSVSKQVQDHFKPVYEELFKKLRTTFSGFPHESIPRPLLGDSEEEREANFERLWDLGGFNFTCASGPSTLAFLTQSHSEQLPGHPHRQSRKRCGLCILEEKGQRTPQGP